MKNMFSQLGTKKVAGVVLAGATLLVGLGVVSNFSGSQKAANEAALSRFGDSAYNNFTGGSSASRADLERQMSARQDGYSARFLKGKSDGTEPGEAYGSDGAYAEGVRADEGFVYGSDGAYGSGSGVNAAGGAYANGETYNPFGSTYEQGAGGIEEGSLGGSGLSESDFQAAQGAAAAAAGKGVKGKGGKSGKGGAESAAAGQRGKLRPATQINKLAASKGGSSFGSGAGGGALGGGSASFGAGSAMGGGDNNTRALPQAGAGDANSQAFKFGRAGGMGGFNVGFNGQEGKGGITKGRGAANDLYLATAYSGKALATRQDDGSKALAEAAFDGSNPEDIVSPIQEGASIDKVASTLLDANSMGGLPNDIAAAMGKVGKTLQETAEQQAELAELQNQYYNKYVPLVLGTLGFGLAILILAQLWYMYPAAWWFGVAAGVVSLAALAFISYHLWGWGGESSANSLLGLVEQMRDPDKFGPVNQGMESQFNSMENWAYGISGGLTAILGLCWIPWSGVQDIICTGLEKIASLGPKTAGWLIKLLAL